MHSNYFNQHHSSKRLYGNDVEYSQPINGECRTIMMSKLWLKQSGICDTVDDLRNIEATSFVNPLQEITQSSLKLNENITNSDDDCVYLLSLIHRQLLDDESPLNKYNVQDKCNYDEIAHQNSHEKSLYLNLLTCDILHAIIERYFDSENDRMV